MPSLPYTVLCTGINQTGAGANLTLRIEISTGSPPIRRYPHFWGHLSGFHHPEDRQFYFETE
ncbi:MAG: hypothetical protein WC774_00090 [Candidatus Gracilibacteria bacterium]